MKASEYYLHEAVESIRSEYLKLDGEVQQMPFLDFLEYVEMEKRTLYKQIELRLSYIEAGISEQVDEQRNQKDIERHKNSYINAAGVLFRLEELVKQDKLDFDTGEKLCDIVGKLQEHWS